MDIKFTGTLLLLGALLGPVSVYAEDLTSEMPGQYFDDSVITTKIKAVFVKDMWLKGLGINVRTDHGIVDLNGTVNSQNQSDRATKLAAQVKSVIAVNNKLTVQPR